MSNNHKFYKEFREKHPVCDWSNEEIDAHYE